MSNQKLLTPQVKWSQKMHFIAIKIYIRELKDENVNITNLFIQFNGSGIGASGRNNYYFEIKFYKEVQTEGMRFFQHEQYIELRIPKKEVEHWPRLTLAPERLHWLKTDWNQTDILNSDSDDEKDKSETENSTAQDEALKKMLREAYSKTQNEKIDDMKKQLESNPIRSYITSYNFILWCLFSYIFVVSSRAWIAQKWDSTRNVYDFTISTLIIAISIQGFEVFNTGIGWVKGAFIPTLMQNAGRWLFLFLVVIPHEGLHQTTSVALVISSWSAIEVVRYPYYMLQNINHELSVLTWLRYTIWIPLYPSGMLGEMFTILQGIPEIASKGKFDLSLPNPMNFGFHFATFLKCYVLLVSFIFGPWMLYYMYKNSMKKLGLNSKNTEPKEKIKKPSQEKKES